MIIDLQMFSYCKNKDLGFALEVTPNTQRLRKIYLDENERKRQEKQIG